MNLMDKRTQRPFRMHAASPSYLDEQIVTPREWKPRLSSEQIVQRTEKRRVPLTRVQNLAKQLAWFLCKVVFWTAVVIVLIVAFLSV